MIRSLSNCTLDQVKIRLLLGDLKLPHRGIDLVLSDSKLFPKDGKVQQAYQHKQQATHEAKQTDYLDTHPSSYFLPDTNHVVQRHVLSSFRALSQTRHFIDLHGFASKLGTALGSGQYRER